MASCSVIIKQSQSSQDRNKRECGDVTGLIGVPNQRETAQSKTIQSVALITVVIKRLQNAYKILDHEFEVLFFG